MSVRVEPRGLDRDAEPLADYRAEGRRKSDAHTGSNKLLEAILRARGTAPVPVPVAIVVVRRVRKVRRGRPLGCVKRRRRYARIFRIQAEVAKWFGTTVIDMAGPERTGAPARHLAMFLSRSLTDASYPDIGRHFNRDHSTVIDGVRRVQRKIDSGDAETITAYNAVAMVLAR